MGAAGIVHRDLKPDNIMLCQIENKIKPSDVRLVDFGLATRIDGEHLYTRCGTPGYVAPEVILATDDDKNFKVSPKADVFAVGVMMYTLITGILPFEDKNDKEKDALQRTIEGKVDFNHPRLQSQNKDVVQLLRGLLANKPKDRLSAREAVAMPLFDNIRSQIQISSQQVTEDGLSSEAEIEPDNEIDEHYAIKSLDKRSMVINSQEASEQNSIAFRLSPFKKMTPMRSPGMKSPIKQIDPSLLPGSKTPNMVKLSSPKPEMRILLSPAPPSQPQAMGQYESQIKPNPFMSNSPIVNASPSQAQASLKVDANAVKKAQSILKKLAN